MYMIPVDKIVGRTFGRLKALSYVGTEKRGKVNARMFECECECGTRCVVRYDCLKSGGTASCGCLQKQKQLSAVVKHGAAGRGGISMEYQSWVAMISRCHGASKNELAQKTYKDKGIVVCDRWRNSFADFISDVGPRPSVKHSIDRYPNNKGNYEPGNVRWATRIEQARNMTSNVLVTHNGVTKSITEWGIENGISRSCIYNRIRYGWDAVDAITIKPNSMWKYAPPCR